MTTKPLKERMRTGELYFVFHGMDLEIGEFRMLSYGDGTPRIYDRETLDPRVGEIPISLNLKTAERKLRHGAIGVLMPLSVLFEVFGVRAVKRWFSPMADDFADEMRAYIQKWKKKAKPFRLAA